MSSFLDKTHDGVLCTFNIRTSASAFQQLNLPEARSRAVPDQGKRYDPSGKAVHHKTNLSRLGQSSPASQADLRVGSPL